MLRLADEVAPIQAECRVDLSERVRAESLLDNGGESLRKLDGKALGSDTEHDLEDAHGVVLLVEVVQSGLFFIRRGDSLSACRGHGFVASVAYAVIVEIRMLVRDHADEHLHDVELGAHACAYERVRVNINRTVRIIGGKQGLRLAVLHIRPVDETDRKFCLVGVAVGQRPARERGKQRRDVQLALHSKGEIDVHARREVDVGVIGEVDVVCLDVRSESEFQRDIDVRIGKDVHKLAIDGGYAALPVDGGIDPAEGEVQPEVLADAERDTHGKPFGSVLARKLQTVIELDADRGVQIERIAHRVLDDNAFDVQKIEEDVKQPRAQRDIEIEVAESDVRRRNDGDEFLGYGGDVSAAAARAAARLTFVRDGDRLGRGGCGEEGRDVRLDGKPAEQFLGSVEIDHSVHEPHAQRNRIAVLFGKFDIKVDGGQQTAYRRGYAAAGERAYECLHIGDLGFQLEGRINAEGLRKVGKHRHQELVGVGVADVCECARHRAEVEVRLQTYLQGLHIGKHLVEVEIAECERSRRRIDERVKGGEPYVLVAGKVRRKLGERGVEVISVRHTAHLERDGHTRGSELRGDLFQPHRRREVEIEGNDLGQTEPDILVRDVHAAVDGDLHARIFARESDAPDVVEDLLRESDLHLLKVEDVAVHLDDDVVEDRLDKPHGVRDGFPGLGGGYLAHQLAACKLTVNLGDKLLILRRFRRSEQPRNGVLRLCDEVLDESAEEFIEIDAVHIEFARAEQSAEVGKEHLVLAAVSDARAHILCPCAREFDKQLGVGVVEHVDLRTDVQLQRPLQPVEIDLVVENSGKAFPDFRIQTEESAEGVDEFVGSDAQLFECQIEGDREIESERRILVQLRKVEPPAAVGLGLTLRRLGRGEIALDVDLLIETVVPLQAGAAHIEGDAALLDAVVLFEAGAECVVIEADAHIHAGELAPAAVVGGEVRGNVDGKPLHRGEQPEVDAEDALHHVVNFGGDETVFARRKNPAEHAAQYVGKPDGHDDGLRAVGVGCDAGSADERGDRAADHAYDAAFGGEDVIEKELCKALVFIAAGRSEKFAQSLHHGSGIDVVGLDNGGAGFQTGAIIDEGGVEIIDAEEHLDEVAVDVPLPQFEERLVARVVFEIDVRLDLKGVGIGHRIFDVIEIDDVVQSDQTPRVGVGRLRRVDHHIPCIRPADGLHLLGLSRLSGLRRRDGRDVVPAVRRRVACHKHRRRKAENEHE